jgi:PAS domain-containing protein
VSDQGFLHAASMRARLASLERRLQHSPGDASRVAPECLRELEVAAARLEGLHENLRQRDAELRQLRGIVDSAEQRLGALVTMVDCGYLLTDLTGVIQEANPAASRILNISRKSLAGRPFVLFIASGRVELMGRLTILAEAGTPTDLELRLRPRERQMLNVRTRICAVRDGSGKAVGLQWLLTPDSVATAPLESAEPATTLEWPAV